MTSLSVAVFFALILTSISTTVEENIDINSKFDIDQPTMHYQMGESLLLIKGQKADLDFQDNGSIYFHESVQLNLDDIILTPKSLKLESKNQLITTEQLELQGVSKILIQQAELSPLNNMTLGEQLNIIAPYPFDSNAAIKNLDVMTLKTNLDSIRQLQSRNKQVQKSELLKSKFDQTTTEENKPSLSFTLNAANFETPLGRLKLRFKLTQVSFEVSHQTIFSDYAKYQTGLPILTFYGNVKIVDQHSSQHTDYASLNMSTGLLEFDQNSTYFPGVQP